MGQKYLAIASTWMVGLLHPGCRENPPRSHKSCEPPSPPVQMGTFCFPLVQSFDHCLFPLYWPGALIEALTQFTQQVLSDSWQSLHFLNSDMSAMRKAILQNRMTSDIITASQGGTCVIIQVECCVFMPDASANVSSLLKHMRTQVKALSDSQPQGLNKSVFKSWGSWWEKKLLLILRIVILIHVSFFWGGAGN